MQTAAATALSAASVKAKVSCSYVCTCRHTVPAITLVLLHLLNVQCGHVLCNVVTI